MHHDQVTCWHLAPGNTNSSDATESNSRLGLLTHTYAHTQRNVYSLEIVSLFLFQNWTHFWEMGNPILTCPAVMEQALGLMQTWQKTNSVACITGGKACACLPVSSNASQSNTCTRQSKEVLHSSLEGPWNRGRERCKGMGRRRDGKNWKQDGTRIVGVASAISYSISLPRPDFQTQVAVLMPVILLAEAQVATAGAYPGRRGCMRAFSSLCSYAG